jgi:hypothetical protein
VSDEAAPAQAINRVVLAHRIVQAGILLSLIWKWSFFRLAANVYAHMPLDDPFFPAWLRSVYIVSPVYLITVGATLMSLATPRRLLHRLCAWLTLGGASILCIHQASYNDMTFASVWWSSLWSLWYVHRDWETDPQALLRRGAFLSRLILSVILLGGAAGKWTAAYWSGDVLYDIYFRDRDFWLFNWLRTSFEPAALRDIATWYSRKVIVMETAGGLGLWLLPARMAGMVGVCLFASIALLSNFLLFSVVWCLIGLAAVGFLVQKKSKARL